MPTRNQPAQLPVEMHFVDDGRPAKAWLSNSGRHDSINFPLPDVVVTDLRMPQMDGFELIKWIRSQPRFGDIPIIVYSTSDATADIRRAMELGADKFLTKSPRCGDLVEALQIYASAGRKNALLPPRILARSITPDA